ncbi:helix-turn-helix domain-containing protein [Aminobacter aganoensis]|uniref:Transcriptional regulator with XRE-family HTH domain n=1 Tax=Aminobacter aganoensis TaxID=83264 RepID=A0A7X0F4Z0_9HYPH|nr:MULTISPECIES: XRE family transcriptional regulator [Aminobacter]MBB6353193.1 transcriptional regulator with XRE-family HTH domain [Aminobacter aganoensis]
MPPHQYPGSGNGSGENPLELAIGIQVRACRTRLGMTAADLARASRISVGMMSKIENGVISASLATLQALSRALDVPLTTFLRGREYEGNAIFVPAGAETAFEMGEARAAQRYKLLGYFGTHASSPTVETYLFTLDKETDAFPPLEHFGMEFLYLLEGEMTYRIGSMRYLMGPGDSLSFAGHTPHGPEQLIRLPVRFLSTISYL